jgi:hypothetical protein
MGKPKPSAVSSGSEDEDVGRASLTQGVSSSDIVLGGGPQNVGRLARLSQKYNQKSPPNTPAMPPTGPEADNEQEQEMLSYIAPPEIDEEQMSRDRTKTKEDIATASQYCHDVPGLMDPNKCRALKVSPDESRVSFGTPPRSSACSLAN